MPAPFPLEVVRSLPKAELHVHLEGTVDPATLLALAERHGVEPPAPDEDGIRRWLRFDGFDDFLDRYFTILRLLREPEDFASAAEAYLDRAHAQGVVHVEFHVSATAHLLEGGAHWPSLHDGIVAGCRRAEARTGISWGLIPDVSPHLPATDCARAVEAVLAHDTAHLVAVGMGGPADRWWTDDYAPIYDRVREAGLVAVAHAGEHGGPEEVTFAVERFGAVRIQHGIGAADDPDVLTMLAERGIPCDVCPGSNLALAAVADAAAHPLPRMLAAGVVVTLGTDDPPLFATDLLDEYRRAWDWCDLDEDALRALCRNSLEAALAPPERRATWLAHPGLA